MRSRLQAILEQKQLTGQGFANTNHGLSDPVTDIGTFRKEKTAIWGSRDCYFS
ncbi:hypothetical protein RYO59_002590 [Thermosynechococcaceae cyanobacterium Okahandja]